MRARNSPGTLSTLRPKKSLIWVLAMMTAMPFVNPTTTGRGMYFTAVPSPVTPKMTSSTPAISVHMNNPSRPYRATIPKTTTTNAPVGPPICVVDPPNAEITKPATIAQYNPACGATPEAIANAIASGSATSTPVTPARTSAANLCQLYSFKQEIDLGSQSCIYVSPEPLSRRLQFYEGKFQL